MNESILQPPARSRFVTALARILIALNALAVLISLVQIVLVYFLLPGMLEELGSQIGQAELSFPLGIFRGMSVFLLVVSAFMMYAAYALLKRRDWARRTYVVYFALCIAMNLLSAAACVVGFGISGFGFSNPMFDSLPAGMRGMMAGMLVVGGVFVVVTCVLLGWFIKRLNSPAIRAEFADANRVT